jgi:hypothetical protein
MSPNQSQPFIINNNVFISGRVCKLVKKDFVMPVRRSTLNNPVPVGWIFVKFCTASFIKICWEYSNVTKIGQEQKALYIQTYVHLWLIWLLTLS